MGTRCKTIVFELEHPCRHHKREDILYRLAERVVQGIPPHNHLHPGPLQEAQQGFICRFPCIPPVGHLKKYPKVCSVDNQDKLGEYR